MFLTLLTRDFVSSAAEVSQKENKRFHLDAKIMRANPVKVNIFSKLKKTMISDTYLRTEWEPNH